MVNVFSKNWYYIVYNVNDTHVLYSYIHPSCITDTFMEVFRQGYVTQGGFEYNCDKPMKFFTL